METPIDLSDFNQSQGNIVELNIDGRIFEYKLPTNEDEINWADEYMETVETKDPDGNTIKKIKANLGKFSLCKFQNIISVPYSKEQINAVIKINKEFSNLTKQEKKDFLFKLDGKIVSKIITEFSRIEKDSRDLKKNS